MANVNTESAREEIARVEQEIATLSDAGKVPEETRILLNTLLMIANMLVAIFRRIWQGLSNTGLASKPTC